MLRYDLCGGGLFVRMFGVSTSVKTQQKTWNHGADFHLYLKSAWGWVQILQTAEPTFVGTVYDDFKETCLHQKIIFRDSQSQQAASHKKLTALCPRHSSPTMPIKVSCSCLNHLCRFKGWFPVAKKLRNTFVQNKYDPGAVDLHCKRPCSW